MASRQPMPGIAKVLPRGANYRPASVLLEIAVSATNKKKVTIEDVPYEIQEGPFGIRS